MTMQQIPDFTIDRPAPIREQIVHLSEFGVSTDPGFCNGPAFSRAIAYCKSIQASRLVLPKGRYFFLTGEHIVFEELNDFIFDGQGSELVFSSIRSMIHIKNCNRCVIRDVELDWDWEKAPLASIGRVTSVAPDFTSFDMIFPEYDEVDENIDIRGMNPANRRTWTPGTENGHESFDKPPRRMKVSADTIRFFPANPSEKTYLRTEQVYIVRHYIYDSNGVVSENCSHLSLDQITVYACPGHAFFTYGDQHHWEIVNCKVMKRPGTTRCVSATADGYHIGNSKGYFRMERCDFSFTGDDCLNIHDNSSGGIEVVDEHTVIAKHVKPIRNFFAGGDPIEFRGSDLSPTGLTLTVDSAEWNFAKEECILTFKERMPHTLPADTILFNRRFDSGHYVIRNNFFHRNRARGILLHADNGLVEHNHFFLNQGSAIQLECGTTQQLWSEGYGICNVVIRNNYIDSCDVNHWNMAVFYMGVYLPSGRTAFPIFTDILIERNTIINCPQMAFFLSSCADVVVRDNAIINSNAEAVKSDTDNDGNGLRGREKYRGTIMVSHCENVRIVGNTRLDTVSTDDDAIYFDKLTSTNILIEKNKGFA